MSKAYRTVRISDMVLMLGLDHEQAALELCQHYYLPVKTAAGSSLVNFSTWKGKKKPSMANHKEARLITAKAQDWSIPESMVFEPFADETGVALRRSALTPLRLPQPVERSPSQTMKERLLERARLERESLKQKQLALAEAREQAEKQANLLQAQIAEKRRQKEEVARAAELERQRQRQRTLDEQCEKRKQDNIRRQAEEAAKLMQMKKADKERAIQLQQEQEERQRLLQAQEKAAARLREEKEKNEREAQERAAAAKERQRQWEEAKKRAQQAKVDALKTVFSERATENVEEAYERWSAVREFHAAKKRREEEQEQMLVDFHLSMSAASGRWHELPGEVDRSDDDRAVTSTPALGKRTREQREAAVEAREQIYSTTVKEPVDVPMLVGPILRYHNEAEKGALQWKLVVCTAEDRSVQGGGTLSTAEKWLMFKLHRGEPLPGPVCEGALLPHALQLSLAFLDADEEVDIPTMVSVRWISANTSGAKGANRSISRDLFATSAVLFLYQTHASAAAQAETLATIIDRLPPSACVPVMVLNGSPLPSSTVAAELGLAALAAEGRVSRVKIIPLYPKSAVCRMTGADLQLRKALAWLADATAPQPQLEHALVADLIAGAVERGAYETYERWRPGRGPSLLPAPEQFVADFNAALLRCWRAVVPDPYPALNPWPVPELTALCEIADGRVQDALMHCTDRGRLQLLQQALEHMVLPQIEVGRFSPSLQTPLELAKECVAYCSSAVSEERISARLQIQAACNDFLASCSAMNGGAGEVLFPWHLVFRALVLDRLEHIPDELSVVFFPSPHHYGNGQEVARPRRKQRLSWLPQTPRHRSGREERKREIPEVAEGQQTNENDAPQLREEQVSEPPRKMARREEESPGRGTVRLKQELLFNMLEEKRRRQDELLALAASAAVPLEL